MGSSFFKPKQHNIVFEESDIQNTKQKNNTIENLNADIKIEDTKENSKVDTIFDTAKKTKKIVDEIFKKSPIVDINQLSDLSLEDGIIPRTLGSRRRPNIINPDNNELEWNLRYPNFNSEINFFTEKYSMDELEQYLSECSSPEQSSSSCDSSGMVSPLQFEEGNFQGDENEIMRLTENQLQSLFENKILLTLSEQPRDALRLKAILKKAANTQILSEVIDIPNDEGNTAISVAILHGNVEALFYLIQHSPRIPNFIFTEGKRIPFLNYIASNARMPGFENGNGYILTTILHTLINDYPSRDISSFLCKIDQNSGLSLPHLLLILYQNSPDFRLEITKCLKLCFEACPDSINVLCTSIYCGGYTFNVIAHSIILPVTNFEIIQYFMNLVHSEEEFSVYESLIQVHQNEETRNRLRQIITRNSS